MTLAAGTRLGRYEIHSLLGAGGMGEVYLAVDTELNRTVTIKILPSEVAANENRLNRFVQEAKAVSALNHPHILTIYEVGTTGSTHFIAAEFIDGDTLRLHINRGMKLPEILDSLPEPHVSLAHVTLYYNRDWAGSEREFKRAIELDPNYPNAHHWYGICLSVVGRLDESLAELRKAQELDPLSLIINTWLGRILALLGQYDQAIEQLRKTMDLDPTFMLTHYRLGQVYEDRGMYNEAIAEFEKVASLPGGKQLGLIALAHAYASAGKREEALKRLDDLLKESKETFVSPANIATIYIALNDKEEALAWLEKANNAHDLSIVRLRRDPRLTRFNSDPRFQDLIRRIGIP